MDSSTNGQGDNTPDASSIMLVIETGEDRYSIPIGELLPASFVGRTTNFESIGELLASSGFDTSTQAAFESIPDDDWDQFIESESIFASWREMLRSAGQDWLAKKLDPD